MSNNPAQAPKPRIRMSSFSSGEKLVAVGLVFGVIALLLPWMAYSGGFDKVGAFHGAGLLMAVAWLAVLVLFIARSPLFRNTLDLPRLPATEAVLFAVGGGVQVAGVVLFYVQNHRHDGLARSVQLGFAVALISGVLTLVAGIVAVRSGANTLHTAEQNAPRQPPSTLQPPPVAPPQAYDPQRRPGPPPATPPVRPVPPAPPAPPPMA